MTQVIKVFEITKPVYQNADGKFVAEARVMNVKGDDFYTYPFVFETEENTQMFVDAVDSLQEQYEDYADRLAEELERVQKIIDGEEPYVLFEIYDKDEPLDENGYLN